MNNKQLNKLKNSFFEGYRSAVENRYKYLYTSNPESFPFYQSKQWKINLIILPTFFDNRYLFLISDNEKLKDNQKQDLSIELNTHDLQKYYTDYIQKSDEYIKENSNFVDVNNDNYFIVSRYYLDMINDDFLKIYGEDQARRDYEHFKSISSERMDYKDHEQVLPFNHLNLEDMKRIVNDDTFSYQLDQGLECYKRELYLPAAATFAIAIESFLIRLKKANKIKHKDSDSTMYDKLLESLKQHDAINYRNKVRIEVAYKMRNIVNHSQAGSVAKNDCDFLLNTLKDVIDENQKKLLGFGQI